MNQALCYSDTNVKQFILDSADKSADKIDQELYNALQVAFM